jgi:hypothetical protein
MPFVASTPWSVERPHALVVCCSDGRWHAQMMEFIRARISEHADLYAVPGGPAVLDPWASTFDEARAFEQGMRLFEKHHDLQSIWLIAHEGCAFYREKHPHFELDALRRRQIEDLDLARKKLRERHSEMDVRLIFASKNGNEVVFEPCNVEVAEERP